MTPDNTLSVSLVTYAPDLELLGRVLDSLRQAASVAREANLLDRLELLLVDNGPSAVDSERLRALRERLIDQATFDQVELLTGQGNVGFGRGHNLAVRLAGGRVHLVLNPDVLLHEDALREGLDFLRKHPRVVLASPAAEWPDGSRQYLCKRYPAVLDLALRGFAPGFVRRLFAERLGRYEMRDVCGDTPVLPVAIASGCFMLVRRDALEAVGGFSDAHFLYFEDFDLSLRLGQVGDLAYVPAMRIVHYGGHAAQKGLSHIRIFVRSARIFFARHGWKYV
jgi:GT2 family glycosyltransferase